VLTVTRVIALSGLLMLGLATASAQTSTGETGHQSSNMGPATGNRDGANNGVGTEGSLDHDAGKASSTVSGMNGSNTSFGGAKSQGSTAKVEGDPTQGGGGQSK
jgi:hypothetical protein